MNIIEQINRTRSKISRSISEGIDTTALETHTKELLEMAVQCIVDGETFDFQDQMTAFEWAVDTYNQMFANQIITEFEYMKIAALVKEDALTLAAVFGDYERLDDIDVYFMRPHDLARYFAEEGLLGEVSDTLLHYIDYDYLWEGLLKHDYYEFEFGKKNCIVRRG